MKVIRCKSTASITSCCPFGTGRCRLGRFQEFGVKIEGGGDAKQIKGSPGGCEVVRGDFLLVGEDGQDDQRSALGVLVNPGISLDIISL